MAKNNNLKDFLEDLYYNGIVVKNPKASKNPQDFTRGVLDIQTGTGKPEQSKSTTPTKETQTVLPDAGYVLDKVVVNPIPEQYIIPDGTLEITENGTYDVNLIAQVDVNVHTGEEYEGAYTIIPSIQEQEMLTKNKVMKENVTIEPIPYYETSNESGKTVYIGDKYE